MNGLVFVEITGKGQHIRVSRVTNLLGRLLQVGLGPAYGHLGPFFGQDLGTGPAQTLACSAYDDHLVFQFQIHSECAPPVSCCFPLCLGVPL